MSLFGVAQVAKNALRASQIGLQVVGQNIANANTPGYIREEVILKPAPTQRMGGVLLGLGVEVQAVVQKIDKFLEIRVRNATSERASAGAQEEAYRELEGLLGELGDTDISTALNDFFGGISEILNQPENIAVRNLAALQGQRLSDDIRRLAERVRTLRTDLNDRIVASVDTINNLTKEIQDLNLRIAQAEGGDVSASDAVGLRDQRNLALSQLAGLIDIRADEQPSGSVNVSIGGTFLVFDAIRREVELTTSVDRGLTVGNIQFKDTKEELHVRGGELHGLKVGRDEILGGFIDRLDGFAKTLIYEFNQLFSSGQGLTGYQSLTSEFRVDNASLVLSNAGLPFTPKHGSFKVMVHNQQTNLTEYTDIIIDLDGLDGNDTTLAGLVSRLNAVNGISASLLPSGQVQIKSDSPLQQFAFADDSSGVLAALGLNTFFSGSGATSIAVNKIILDDPGKFAASSSGIGQDTGNGEHLAGFLDRRLAGNGGESLNESYQRLIGDVTQGASVTARVADGLRIFEETLQGQQLAISGVSIDEEALKLIQFQRAYQAAARFIATINELLESLINL